MRAQEWPNNERLGLRDIAVRADYSWEGPKKPPRDNVTGFANCPRSFESNPQLDAFVPF